MSSEPIPAIRINGVSKYFEIYEKPIHRLLQMLHRGRRTFYRKYWALQDISFTVGRGECVGIIGRNGAGKSTLLQVIAGTLAPTSGTVELSGRVAALLELGSGFNPEFTGRENVLLNAVILGLTEAEIAARYDDIVAFADIGEFIDQPVKSYSSGMVLRLAFAVIAHVDADVLIIDEALAVGDAFFTQKCMRFLRRFMEEKTVLFVSHDTAAVNSLCTRAVLLENGRIGMIGTPKEVTQKYLEAIYESVQGESCGQPALPDVPCPGFDVSLEEYRDMRADMFNASDLRNDIEIFQFQEAAECFGKGGAHIEQVVLTDMDDHPLLWVVGGEKVKLKIRGRAKQTLFRPIVGFLVCNKLGQHLFGDNTYLVYKDKPLSFEPGEAFVATFTFRMPILAASDYFVTVAIAEGSQQEHIQHQWIHDALRFVSHSTSCSTGLIGIPMQDISLDSLAGRADGNDQ